MKTSAQSNADRRAHMRYALTGRLPAVFFSEAGETLTVLAIDCSKFGIGIIADQGVNPQEKIFMQVEGAERPFIFKIMWLIGPTFGEADHPVYRYGLHLVEEDDDLEKSLRGIDTLGFEDLD